MSRPFNARFAALFDARNIGKASSQGISLQALRATIATVAPVHASNRARTAAAAPPAPRSNYPGLRRLPPSRARAQRRSHRRRCVAVRRPIRNRMCSRPRAQREIGSASQRSARNLWAEWSRFPAADTFLIPVGRPKCGLRTSSASYTRGIRRPWGRVLKDRRERWLTGLPR